MNAAAVALKKGPCALFLGGRALREEALDQAGRIAAATGARLICETFPARLQRGAGRVAPERLPYFGEMAAEALKEFSQLIMVGAKAPVAFFAYPGKPGWLSPKDANIVTLADPREDALAALTALADELRAPTEHGLAQAAFAPPMGTGKLDAAGVGAVVAAHLPEDAIVSDEAATAGMGVFPMTQGAARHDWMTLTGGSIGQGLPLGVGAAVACPDRKIVCLQADGSAMYTVQALWTMARENLDTYKAALARRRGPANPKAGFSGGTAIGALREIVVAETDAEARRIAQPAAEFHLQNINWLRGKHGYKDFTNRLRTPGEATYDDLVSEGVVIAGSPATVLARIEQEAAALGGINYLLAYMFFGNMLLADALRSQQLFAQEVMPKLAKV